MTGISAPPLTRSVGPTDLQLKLDEAEQTAQKGGKKQLHKLETRVRKNSDVRLKEPWIKPERGL